MSAMTEDTGAALGATSASVGDDADLSLRKSEARRNAREITRSLDAEYFISAGTAISHFVLTLPEYACAKRIFAFRSSRTEPDTGAVLEQTIASGRDLALPRTKGHGIMDFGRVNSLTELVSGRFGIEEPPETAETLIPARGDMILVPCVACGLNGVRLGHGGGYYDRFLDGCEACAVMLCFDALVSDCLPSGELDRRVGIIITEKGVFRTGV